MILQKIRTVVIAVIMLTFSTNVFAYSDTNYKGTWDNNIYTHTGLGIHVYLPIGWWPPDLADVIFITDILEVSALNLDNYKPMMVAYSAFGDNGLYMSRYMLAPGTTNQQALNIFRQYLAETESNLLGYDLSQKVRIGNYYWYNMPTYNTLQGIKIYVNYYITIQNSVMYTIAVITSYVADDGVGISFIYDYGTPPPDDFIKLALDDAHMHPIVGNWAWDGHIDWWYEIFPDGTGLRGLYGEEQFFLWFIANDYRFSADGYNVIIFIVDEGSVSNYSIELWSYDILRNILVLDSLQVNGLIFMYHRVD